MATDRLRTLLAQAFPDAGELEVQDRTGTGDHFQVTVASPRFSGLSLIDQHKLVYAPVQHLLDDGSIHALQIKTEAAP